MKNLIDKSELISKLQTLEGLSNDERSSLIGLLREHKKYGLVWEDKPEDVEERLREELPVLREIKDKAILSDEPEAPNHILIEGDNLEALTALSYTHEGRIDVIYIDPPYNTGNKDFVYNDSFVDTEDSYRHSKWLSFMNKRLKIAKKLLSDIGAIFVSIDDNEQANLKILCDEVFGSANFIGLITRATGTTTGQDTGSLGKACDYIVAYSKYPNYQIGGIPLSEKDLSRYDMSDEKGNFSILQLRRTGGEDRREDRPTMFFPIIAPDGTEVYPYGPTGYESRWRVGPEKVKNMIKEDLLFFKKDKDGQWKVYYKFYAEGKTKRPSNLWTDLDGNKKAQIELKSIIFDAKFETPKPIQVVKRIMELTTNKTSTIIDFFAGSGTTLQATMQLNAEDGGYRQCILVTNNENNICEEVTYERNKRVINGYTTPKGVEVAGLKANTLRYYKTDYISRDRTQKNMRDLVAAATDLLCIKEDLYDEQKTFGRFKLKPQLARYFNNGKRHMLIVYREELIDEIAEEIKNLDFAGKRLKIYVFSPGRYVFTDNFREVEDKVELVALPAAIYDAYQKVLPKRREKLMELENKDEDGEHQSSTTIPTDLFEGQGV